MFLLGMDRLDGGLDAGGSAVEVAHDFSREENRSFENLLDSKAHGLIESVFHEQES